MSHISYFLVCFLLLLDGLYSPVFSQTLLKFGTVDIEAYGALRDRAHVRLEEAYEQMGIKIAVKKLPAKRSLLDANRGLLDGELVRIEGMEKKFPNLIMIRPAVTSFKHLSLSRSPDVKITKVQDLRKYKVAYLNGIQWQERLVEGTDAKGYNDYGRALKLLELGRIDMILVDQIPIKQVLEKRTPEQNESLHFAALPIAEEKLFHYLHKKHSALIPRLEQVLRDLMERESRNKK